MFQKYKVLDVNTKHSIFLESVHLQSQKKVLMHKIISQKPETLKRRLLAETTDNSIVITEYYESEHALFVILEDAKPLAELINTIPIAKLAELFLQMNNMSQKNQMLFHNQLFIQGGKLKVYCLGGCEEMNQNTYTPPELAEPGIRDSHNQCVYIWNLGMVFYNLLCPEQALNQSQISNSHSKQKKESHKEYRSILADLQTRCQTPSPHQPFLQLIKSMLKLSPAQRITWSIVSHSLQIIIEQSLIQRPHTHSRHHGNKLSHNHQPTILKSLLNSTESDIRSSKPRQSFTNKSSHRRLKPSKSMLNLSTACSSKLSLSYSKPIKGVYKPPRDLLKSDAFDIGKQNKARTTHAQSFLQILEQRKKTKPSNSFLIKNQMISPKPSCIETPVSNNIVKQMENSSLSQTSETFQKNPFSYPQKSSNSEKPISKYQNKNQSNLQQKQQKYQKQKSQLKDFLQKQKSTKTPIPYQITPTVLKPQIEAQLKTKDKPLLSTSSNLVSISLQGQKSQSLSLSQNQTQSINISYVSNVSYEKINQKQALELSMESYSDSINTLELEKIQIANRMSMEDGSRIRKDKRAEMSGESVNRSNLMSKKVQEQVQVMEEIEEFQEIPSVNSYYKEIKNVPETKVAFQETERQNENDIKSKEKEKKIGGALGSWRDDQNLRKKHQEQPQTHNKQPIKTYSNLKQPQSEQPKASKPKPAIKKTRQIHDYEPSPPLPSDSQKSSKQLSLKSNYPKSLTLPNPSTAKSIRAFNLLGEVVKHANVNLKAQRSKWMVQCFFIYKCYWAFRTDLTTQKETKVKMQNIQSFIKDNQSITLGLNSMYTVVQKVTSTEPSCQQYKPLITMAQLSGDWKPKYIQILSTFFFQMAQIVKTERIHLVSKGKFKVLLKFCLLLGVAVIIIDQYKSKSQQEYDIVDTYKILAERLAETNQQEVLTESILQEIEHRVNKLLKNY